MDYNKLPPDLLAVLAAELRGAVVMYPELWERSWGVYVDLYRTAPEIAVADARALVRWGRTQGLAPPKEALKLIAELMRELGGEG